MRNLIGQNVEWIVDGFNDNNGFTAILVEDMDTTIGVMGNDGEKVRRFPKNRIVSFTPEKEPGEYVPFHILACENKSINCPGVQFIQEGAGFSQNDLEKFMGNCPARCSTCTKGSKGELRSVDGGVMRSMFANMMFGEYPRMKEASDE